MRTILKNKMWFLALLLVVSMTGCGGDDDGGSSGPGPAGPAPNLGTSSTYGVFASSAAVTLAVDSLVTGDVGLNPAGACNNCTGVTVTGAIENGTAAAIQAQTDFMAAYVDASTRSTNACVLASGELSAAQGACPDGTTPGPIYGPGLYRSASAIGVGADLTITLDAKGNADAVFIFQTDSAITTGTNSKVILAGNAKAKNVFWMAGTAATLGVSSIFKGTVITNSEAVSVLNGIAGTPTLVEGRLFSSGAAVGVGAFATVTVPQ